jgi:hypothetical protein
MRTFLKRAWISLRFSWAESRDREHERAQYAHPPRNPVVDERMAAIAARYQQDEAWHRPLEHLQNLD